MSSLLLPRRFYNQPQGLTNLQNNVIYAQYGNISSAGPISLLNGAAAITTSYGIGLQFADYTDDVAVSSIGKSALKSSGTVFILADFSSAILGSDEEYPRLFTECNSAGTNRGATIVFARSTLFGGTNISFGMARAGTTVQRCYSQTIPTPSGIEAYAATWTDDTYASVKFYKNGELLSNSAVSVSNGSGLYADSTQVEIGGLTSANRSSAATIFLTLAFDKALSDQEISSLYANPWQLFRVSE